MAHHWAMSLCRHCAASLALRATNPQYLRHMAAQTAIDFAPLTTPMSRAEIDAWKVQAKASGASWAPVTWFTPVDSSGDFRRSSPGIVAVMVIPFAFVFGASFLFSPSRPSDLVSAIIPLVIIIGVFFALTYAIIGGFGALARRWETWARMDKFATANGMMFSPRDAGPSYPGAIFGIGDHRLAVDHVRSIEDPANPARFFDFGNYRYTTGSGKNRTTRTWGFLAFHLDRRLPNMVLDAKANNGFFGTNLPASFVKDQAMSLEGDFDRYFTLYAPQAYERDALYVFTPDLMALLIDEASPFDVEIIDDWMFVYSNTAFRTGDANLYARLFRIMDTVGTKTLTQTDRYVDERVGDFAANIVAPAGARLKRRVSIASVIVAVVVAGFWIWGIVGDVLGR